MSRLLTQSLRDSIGPKLWKEMLKDQMPKSDARSAWESRKSTLHSLELPEAVVRDFEYWSTMTERVKVTGHFGDASPEAHVWLQEVRDRSDHMVNAI